MYVCSLQCGRTALPSTGVKINQSINQLVENTRGSEAGSKNEVKN